MPVNHEALAMAVEREVFTEIERKVWLKICRSGRWHDGLYSIYVAVF